MGLSTHILDTAIGRPAANVGLRLEKLDAAEWKPEGEGSTDADGRCKTLLGDAPLEAGTYRIRFETRQYFDSQKVTSLYPYVEITFTIAEPGQHYHIPLLLTANGYTTYRGS